MFIVIEGDDAEVISSIVAAKFIPTPWYKLFESVVWLPRVVRPRTEKSERARRLMEYVDAYEFDERLKEYAYRLRDSRFLLVVSRLFDTGGRAHLPDRDTPIPDCVFYMSGMKQSTFLKFAKRNRVRGVTLVDGVVSDIRAGRIIVEVNRNRVIDLRQIGIEESVCE